VRSVEADFDCATVEAAVKRAEDGALAKETLGIVARAKDRKVNPEVNFALGVKLADQLHFAEGTAGDMQAGPAEFHTALDPKENCALSFLRRRWRDQPRNQALRLVEEHAVGFAGLFVAHDLAAKRVRSILCDSCKTDGRAVGDCAVAVGTHEENGIFRGDTVKVPASWECLRLPKCLDPAASGDPGPRLGQRDALLHFCEEFLDAANAFEIELQLTLTHAGEMTVGIGEARDDRSSFQVNDFGAGHGLGGVRIGTNEDNIAALDSDRLGMRLLFINGVDVAIGKENVCGGHGGESGKDCAQTEKCRNKDDSHGHIVRFSRFDL
jgi:hypothetical protein